jgi:curli biogenesis system outer membrane secretion channel CsgG
MKTRYLLAALLLTAAINAPAATPACEAQATEKKLAGAAKTSFLKKCDRDTTEAATKDCDTKAAEKKLAGAAKTSFVTKCVKDATAAK